MMEYPFIGTAAQALDRVEQQIKQARKDHKSTRALLARRKLLVARCVALGAK